MNIKHLLLSEVLAEPGAALLARDLDRELAEEKIKLSEHQCLSVEQHFVREYRLRFNRQDAADNTLGGSLSNAGFGSQGPM